MCSTHTRAGVPALIVDASLVPRTLRVNRTLRLTLNIRVANIVKDTSAGGCLSSLGAFSIATTWRWVAWLNYLNGSRCC